MYDLLGILFFTVLPAPVMTITQAGSTVADQDFSLTCKVTVAAPLSVRPIVITGAGRTVS